MVIKLINHQQRKRMDMISPESFEIQKSPIFIQQNW